ncbi:MAG: hypothetical protein WBA17_15475 [Saprospiraceae bacterium]
MKYLYLTSILVFFSAEILSGQYLIEQFEVGIYGGPQATLFNIEFQTNRSIRPGLSIGAWLQTPVGNGNLQFSTGFRRLSGLDFTRIDRRVIDVPGQWREESNILQLTQIDYWDFGVEYLGDIGRKGKWFYSVGGFAARVAGLESNQRILTTYQESGTNYTNSSSTQAIFNNQSLLAKWNGGIRAGISRHLMKGLSCRAGFGYSLTNAFSDQDFSALDFRPAQISLALSARLF